MDIKEFWNAVLKQDKIVAMNEYWGDDGIAPQWRLDKNIGMTIC